MVCSNQHIHWQIYYELGCLKDTISSCICLMGRGAVMPDEYTNFSVGIKAIQGHVFNGGINGESVCVHDKIVFDVAGNRFIYRKHRVTNAGNCLRSDSSIYMNLKYVKHTNYILRAPSLVLGMRLLLALRKKNVGINVGTNVGTKIGKTEEDNERN